MLLFDSVAGLVVFRICSYRLDFGSNFNGIAVAVHVLHHPGLIASPAPLSPPPSFPEIIRFLMCNFIHWLNLFVKASESIERYANSSVEY
jgi:hypothetical protein